ncbi:MAG: hypothetical protein FRX48_00337 [Lasallia pustulata]|uniref:DUF1749-domain-containing protein n=1 Tax=Lasallia pustulata TaxID=136370 RepID=A0A5M8Q3N2_9LECA|nr:MAG: hypothetical protein FRX48_00337 [Lasallia pustulata]
MNIEPIQQAGVLHRYATRLVAFEHTRTPHPSIEPRNILLFVPGLGDGFLTVPYSTALAPCLPASYSLVQPLLSSSYNGWGTSSLGLDVAEIAQCVAYFRRIRPGAKVVLMGHSTGCQDVIHYLLSPGLDARPTIDGVIMQAPISDRECFLMVLDQESYDAGVKVAQAYVEDGRGEDVLPGSVTGMFPRTPISARRWLSLTSPGPEHDGEDDYFSSDFSDERLKATFGKIGATAVPICFAFSGADEHVPNFVDKERLVSRWERFIREGGGVVDEASGVVRGATHNLARSTEERTSDDSVQDLLSRVVGVAQRVETGKLQLQTRNGGHDKSSF